VWYNILVIKESDKMKILERTTYLERLMRLKGTPDIKIVTGLRRSGKSELLHQYIEKIKRTETNVNIIFIDYADLSFDDLKNYKELYKYVESRYEECVPNMLFVDEVQMCEKFELAINSFHNSRKYDIYITGSNAFLLSSDLSTLFTGRYIEIPVFPFSFSEFCSYFEKNGEEPSVLNKFLREGGLPGSYLYSEAVDKASYIRDVFNTLIKRDLVEKYHILEEARMDSLTDFLMDNISSLTSPNRISEVLGKNGETVNRVTICNYLKYLCSAFLFYRVRRYDIRGKKYLETIEKYYLSDLSFRYALLGSRNMDYGRAYENMVAIELMRRGYEIYVGKLYQKEVDFVAMKQNEKIYIQVSDDISSEETLDRELTPLRMIKDSYPKILIANTKHDTYDIEGIKVYDLARWLLAFEK